MAILTTPCTTKLSLSSPLSSSYPSNSSLIFRSFSTEYLLMAPAIHSHRTDPFNIFNPSIRAMPFFLLICFLLLAPLASASAKDTKLVYVPSKGSDVLNGTWEEVLRLGEHENCLSTNISYLRLIPHPSIQGRWAVPHSLITMDSVRCGLLSPNATDAQLDADPRMEYFLFDLVSTSRKAARSRLTAPYMRLNGLPRQILAGLELILGKERARASTFIGWEGSRERVCGGVRIPLDTFTIFARIGNRAFPVGKYIKDFETTTFNLLKNHVYHIMVSPAGSGEADRFCPYQLKSKKRVYPIRACFPAEMWVRTRSGRRKTMDELAIGDSVEYTDAIGRTRFTHIMMFTHQSRNVIAQFVTIHTRSGRRIKLSHGHYMDDNRRAGDIEIGDFIMLDPGRSDRVTHLEESYGTGLYNPQTTSGRINVNGIAVSTYTQAVEPTSAHAALLPLRALWCTRLFSFYS